MRHRLDLTQDIEDKLALSAALAAACSLSISEVLDRLEPRILVRAEKMRHAVEAAAQMGRAHRLAEVQPYCPLAAGGDDSRLMAASGETEPATHPAPGTAWRWQAHTQMRTSWRARPAGPLMPAEQTGRDFPRRPVGPGPPGDAAPAAHQVAHAARAQPPYPPPASGTAVSQKGKGG